MVITLHFCELVPQLLQLLVYLRSSSALPINFGVSSFSVQ